MQCKKCGKEMPIINSIVYGNGLRVTRGCCGTLKTRNEDRPETIEKYKLPSQDEIAQNRNEELKRYNSVLAQPSPQQQQTTNNAQPAQVQEQQTEKKYNNSNCYSVPCDKCAFAYKCIDAK